MYWHDCNHAGIWLWPFAWLLILFVLVAWRGWWWRQPGRRWQPEHRFGAAEPADPEALLAARFARGEIDAEEYAARLRTLRDPIPDRDAGP